MTLKTKKIAHNFLNQTLEVHLSQNQYQITNWTFIGYFTFPLLQTNSLFSTFFQKGERFLIDEILLFFIRDFR